MKQSVTYPLQNASTSKKEGIWKAKTGLAQAFDPLKVQSSEVMKHPFLTYPLQTEKRGIPEAENRLFFPLHRSITSELTSRWEAKYDLPASLTK